ncbi:MAG: carboxypeptidase-like regulatory domain-containing protein [Bacteroidales bacterium]|nr:carboxypeptidase-like regulatory domain-containing protein [Bacteroidales bacterium]
MIILPKLKTLALIGCLLLSAQSFSQITVSGRVTDKQDKLGLPGVNLVEKGTRNGVCTDMDGFFSLQVTGPESVLEVSFIGYVTQEIKVSETRSFDIELKQFCHVDFFDVNDIGIGVSSGLRNTPIGGFAYLTFPFIRLVILRGGIEYQSDLSENSKTELELRALHVLADCGYDADIDLRYRDIRQPGFSFTDYQIEGKLNFSRPWIFSRYQTVFLGYGLSSLLSPTADYRNSSGILFGLGTQIRHPLYMNVNIKATWWMDYWEWVGEIHWQFRGLIFSANYTRIETYSEVNLKLGYIFNY